MQVAPGHTRRMLGPFAVHDVFPFNAEPIIVHDLAFRKDNEYVGLDVVDSEFGEIRAEEDSDVKTDPTKQMIQWRAVCHIDTRRRAGQDPLSPLSRVGTQLVKGYALSQEMALGASLAVIVQGTVGHFRWDCNSTPPSPVLYSILPNGSHLKFPVRSLETQNLHRSIRHLRMLDIIMWLRTNKSNTSDTSLDGIIERYKRQFPRERSYQEQHDKHRPQVHRSHIRTALMTPFSMRSIRKVIQREGLISTEGLSTLKMDFKCFRDTGHLREAQPTRYLQPQASSHPDTEADVPEDLSVTSDQIDEILNELPIEFFMYHEPPRTGETWTCPYEGCRDTIPSNPGYSGAGEFDAVIVTLRSRISKHLWEEHVPKDLSQDSLGKLASYLAHVES